MIDAKFTMMTTQQVEKLDCKLAVPTIVSMLITIFNRREFTKFEFWMAVVILIMLAIIGVMLLLL